MIITGKFDINLEPLDFSVQGENAVHLGRMSIDKTFHGELDASSKGEMLSAMTPVKGSAGYVAVEQVTGSLLGKQGGFVLQHFAIMDKGKNHQVVEVIPGSGTGELIGITGKMIITIEKSQHYYEFNYSLT